MSKKALDELRDKFCDELDEIARKPEMNAGDLETVHKLTDTIKNIDKICMLEDCDDDGYSGMWEAEGRMHGGYNEGDSYARRGMHYVRGHYSRDGAMDGGYSQAHGRGGRGGRGYSRDSSTESTIRHLENMMEDASSEREREAIKQCIHELKG